jgi:2-phosphosulfolactate phosphatase
MSFQPQILRKSLLAGAREAEGVAVVIDVFRAFTSAALMLHLGAQSLVLLTEPADVLKLKDDEDYLAVGEVNGRKVAGFDLGNSPSEILAAGQRRFAGRAVAQRTSAGVAGAVAAARHADVVILGSYTTASAAVRYMRSILPPVGTISLVDMGRAGQEVTPEDEACADYLEHLLTGLPYDHPSALQRIIQHEATQKFLRGNQPHYPPADPILCLQRDLFDFTVVANWEDGRLVARRVEVPPIQGRILGR